MLRLRKRRITVIQNPLPVMWVLIVAAPGLKGKERRGTLQQHPRAKNLPNAAETAQETQVGR